MENLEQKQSEIKSEGQGTPKPRSKLLPIILPICMLVVLIGAVIFNANRPIVRFKAALNNRDYSDAEVIYSQNSSNQKVIEQSNNFMMEYLEKIKDKYAKGTVTYKDAVTAIAWVKDYEDVESTNNIEDLIYEIKSSKDAYAEAKKHMDNKQYWDALDDYSKVIAEDEEHYAKIQNNIDSAKEGLCAEAVATANEQIKNDQLVDAFKTLSNIYEYRNSEVEQLLTEVKSKAEKQAIDREQTLLDSGDYKTVCLDIEGLPDGLKTDKIIAIQNTAANNLIEQAATKEQTGNYDEALQLLTNEKGDSLFPAWQDKIEEIEIAKLSSFKGKIDVSYDKVDGTYSIYPKNYLDKSGLTASISVGDYTFFFGILSFTSKDLILTNEVIINCDGTQFRQAVDYSQRHTNIGLWRNSEFMILSDNNLGTGSGDIDYGPIVEALRTSNEVIIRFYGNGGYEDVTLSQSLKDNFLMMWDIYQILLKNSSLVTGLL